jgi:uncharacterized protein (TIGR03437 family)
LSAGAFAIYAEVTFKVTAILLLLAGPVRLLSADTVVLSLFPPGGNSPINFEAERSNVMSMATGYMATGDVSMVTPLGKIPLLGASLFFAFGPGSQQIQSLRGTAFVPSPFTSANADIANPVMAEIGFDLGKNLDLGVPVAADRTYIYFKFDAGLEMKVGATNDPNDTKAFSISVPAGVSALELLDPLDPFYYISGGLVTPDSPSASKPGGGAVNKPESSDASAIEKIGVGASIQGLIPFQPQTTYGIQDQAKPFSGNLILSGSVEVPDLPLAVDGYEITGVVPQSANPTFYSLGIVPGLSPWTQMGINGNLSLAYKFLKLAKLGKIADFSFKLGSASAAVQTVNSVRQCYFSGIMQPDTSWIPDWMPFKPEDQERAYGYLSSQLTDFKLHTDGRFAVDATEFGKLTGVPLSDILESTGTMNIDQNGYFLSAETSGNLGPLGASDRQTQVWIPFEGFENAYLQTSGLLRVANVLSVQGQAKLSGTGFAIGGKMANTNLDIDVGAQIARSQSGSLFVQGTMSVPPQFQPDFDSAIESAAATARQAVSQQYDAYQQATKNYNFELSLRGVRALIPPLCDAVNSAIDSGIKTAFAKWPSAFGIDLPGKSAAETDARNQAAPYKQRMTTLKAAVLQPDGDAARAALKAALQDVLNHPRIVVKVAVLGTIVDRQILSSSQTSELQTAVAAVDALPDVSNQLIQAQKIWDAAPKQDVLQATADAIQTGTGAVPRITAIGFNQPLFASPFQVFADVSTGSKTTRVTVPFDPSNPAALGKVVGVAFSATLSTQALTAPPSGASGPLPAIAPDGVVSAAGYQATISPGSWVAIYGQNLAPDTRTWRADEIHNGVLPTELDGVSVTIDGKAAAVYYISPTQISALVPNSASSGLVQVYVTSSAGSSVPSFVTIAQAAPALFEWRGTNGQAFAVATYTDFRHAGDPAVLADPTATPVKPGDTIILWGTGFGPTDPPTGDGLATQPAKLADAPEVTIGGMPADYIGGAVTPGFAGLYEIAVRVPDVPDGAQVVVVTTGGMSSPANVYLSVSH